MAALQYSTRVQGAQCTSEAFTDVLKEAGIESVWSARVDGSTMFFERLWRSVKYEGVYLKAFETIAEARTGIGTYFQFYNSKRRHQSMNRQTPDQVYMDNVEWPQAASSGLSQYGHKTLKGMSEIGIHFYVQWSRTARIEGILSTQEINLSVPKLHLANSVE